MVGSSYQKEVRHSRRPRDRRSRDIKSPPSIASRISYSSTASRIKPPTRRTDSRSVDEPSRCSSRRSIYSLDTRSSRRSKYSLDTRSYSSSGSEVSCRRHHRKHRSRRYDYTKRRSSRRREYSPASSYRSYATDPTNVMSIDTGVNSQSKLQYLGRVVKASDLTDYSDHYTLGSREMEEFEGYLQKHKSRGHRNFYDSDTEGSSAIYSLNESASENPGAASSDDTSGIVEVESRTHRRNGIVGCGYKACFCIDDDSIQGSYGGLREDEVLIASTPSLKTGGSVDQTEADDFTNSVRIAEVSCRSMSRRVERMESTTDSVNSRVSEIQDRDDCESVKTEEPTGVSIFFCSWNPVASHRSDVDSSDDEDDEEDRYHDLPQVVTTSMTQHGNDSTASYTSSNVVWQRSSTYDSIAESLSEERAHAIAKKARAETILNRFKKEKPKVDKPPGIQRAPSGSQRDLSTVESKPTSTKDVKVEDQRTEDHESMDETRSEAPSSIESNREITKCSTNNSDRQTTEISSPTTPNDQVITTFTPALENEIAAEQCDTKTESEAQTIEEFDRSLYDRTFVLGDNVEVATMTEVEAGNGDTGFLVYLRVSRESLTEKGEATVQRFMTARGRTSVANGLSKGTDIAGGWRDVEDGLAVLIVTETDEQGPHEDRPRLLIEENASHYIETLSRLSEASYHCLDIKAQQEVCRVVQSRQFTEIPLKSTSDGNESQHTNPPSCPTPREGVAQFIFCMRTSDMVYRELEHRQDRDDDGNTDENLIINVTQKNDPPLHTGDCNSDGVQSNAKNSVMEVPEGHDARNVAKGEVAASAATQVCESSIEEPDIFDKYIEDFAKSCEGEEIPNTVRQALAAAISKDRTNPKYLRGMSRATVRAHVLLQGGKIPRQFYRSKSVRAADASTATKGNTGISPKHACSIIIGGGEDSTSSRGLSLHRSSGEESLKGTRFIHDEAKSLSGSFSNHSSGIHGYLQFLEEQDNEDDTESGCVTSEKSAEQLTQQTRTISDKAVAEAVDALNELNFNLNYDDSSSSNGNDAESPATKHSHDPAPIPSHIPNVNALLFGHNQGTKNNKCEAVASTKSELTSDERQLKSYEERWRLTQQLLLVENATSRPLSSGSSTRNRVVEFEKTQIDRIGLLRKRRTTASVASSHGSQSSFDEFFDAVSQNSSSS